MSEDPERVKRNVMSSFQKGKIHYYIKPLYMNLRGLMRICTLTIYLQNIFEFLNNART